METPMEFGMLTRLFNGPTINYTQHWEEQLATAQLFVQPLLISDKAVKWR